MSAPNLSFAHRYVSLWATIDADQRHQLIGDLYAEQAEFFTPDETDDINIIGREAIEANIAHVNERDVQGHGLKIEFRDAVTNNSLTRVRWTLIAPDGSTAAPGEDLLTFDEHDQIASDHIFIG